MVKRLRLALLIVTLVCLGQPGPAQAASEALYTQLRPFTATAGRVTNVAMRVRVRVSWRGTLVFTVPEPWARSVTPQTRSASGAGYARLELTGCSTGTKIRRISTETDGTVAITVAVSCRNGAVLELNLRRMRAPAVSGPSGWRTLGRRSGSTERHTNALYVLDPMPTVGAAGIRKGHATMCAPLVDGRAACWGTNNFQQIGEGLPDYAERKVPAVVMSTSWAGPLTAVRDVTIGEMHTCAVLMDGGVACWGRNLGGQLGRASDDPEVRDWWGPGASTIPVRVPGIGDAGGLPGAVAISAAAEFTCALLADTTVACWGTDAEGTLGAGYIVPRPGVRLTPGRVVAPQYGFDEPPGWLTGVVAISAAGTYACALLADSSVVCWGSYRVGFTETTVPNGRPVPVTPGLDGAKTLTGVTAISVGNLHACATLADGGAACWGHEGQGQLGRSAIPLESRPVNDADYIRAPARVIGQDGTGTLSGVRSIHAGPGYTCATLASTEAVCWGANEIGGLGDGTLESRVTPTPVLGIGGVGRLTGVAAMALGGGGTCALLMSGRIACWQTEYGPYGVLNIRERIVPSYVAGIGTG